MPKEETMEEKIARIEQSLKEKDELIAKLQSEKAEVEKKFNSFKLDALSRQVEPAKEEVEEPVSFDFDM